MVRVAALSPKVQLTTSLLSKSLMQPSVVVSGRSSLASSTVGRIGSLGTFAPLISAPAPG